MNYILKPIKIKFNIKNIVFYLTNLENKVFHTGST